MKIYLAGERLGYSHMDAAGQALWTKKVKRRLYSFYYHGFSKGMASTKQRQMHTKSGLTNDIYNSSQLGHEIFLDSGAFTAFTKNIEIDITEYSEFILRNKTIWTACSSLDFIGSGEEAAQATFRNFEKLRNLGAEVQPVFHVREPDRWLQRYIDAGYPYIFIGGMVPETTQWLMQRLDNLWTSLLTDKDGYPKVQIHGFGLTDQSLMFRYPWYSVDSTSWLMTGIFGACVFRHNNGVRKVVFSEHSPEARKFKGWHYNNLTAPAKKLVDSWLEQFDVTAQQLIEHYSYRDVINAAVYQDLEDLGSSRFVSKQDLLFA